MLRSIPPSSRSTKSAATVRLTPSPIFAHGNQSEANDDSGWLITLSDLTLLLICFLALWYAKEHLKRPAGQKAPSVQAALPQAATLDAVDRASPARDELRALEDEIQSFIKDSGLGRDLILETSRNEFLLSLQDSIPFASGKADLRPAALPILQKVAEITLRRPNLRLEINGHTDDRPIATAEFPSNWELSAARASRVARYLIERGVSPERIAVEGYANFRPREAESSPSARSLNRRVEIRLTLNSTAPTDRDVAAQE